MRLKIHRLFYQRFNSMIDFANTFLLNNNQYFQGEIFPLKEVKGYKIDSKDPAIIQAAKVLRLAQIHKLRDLQTCINECIVAMQQITSNPKTDTKLGKVGR